MIAVMLLFARKASRAAEQKRNSLAIAAVDKSLV